MSLLIRETDDLILNRRTIPGPGAADLPRIHGAAVDIFLNNTVGFGVGVHDVTGHLHGADIGISVGFGRKGEGLILAGLNLQHRQIDAFPLDAGGCARFEAHEPYTQGRQGSR